MSSSSAKTIKSLCGECEDRVGTLSVFLDDLGVTKERSEHDAVYFSYGAANDSTSCAACRYISNRPHLYGSGLCEPCDQSVWHVISVLERLGVIKEEVGVYEYEYYDTPLIEGEQRCTWCGQTDGSSKHKAD